MGDLYNSIKILCDLRGVKPAKMCKDLGLSQSIPTDLKAGRKKSISAETASKMANYLGVTVDCLLGKEDKKISASPAEPNKAELISMIQNMSQEEAARMLAMAKVMFGDKR